MKNAYRFFHAPNGSVIPLIPKCGLASTHSAIFKNQAKSGGLNLIRPTFSHNNKPALVPIRDPFERFRSAVWQVNRADADISVDEILDGLEAGTYFNQHFVSQSDILSGCDGCESVTLYRFPEDFKQMLIDGGLAPLSEHRNKSTDKPTLTVNQTDRVKEIYADDLNLTHSLYLTYANPTKLNELTLCQN